MAEAILRNARHNARFTLIGKVKLTDRSLAGGVENKTGTWLGVRDSFGVDIGDGRIIYPNITGGRSLSNGVIYRQGKRDGSGKTVNLQIPIDERNDEEWLEQVAANQFKYVSLTEDEERLSFVDTIDYVEYLQEHLVDGTEVVVTGNVEYSTGKDHETVYRNYEVTGIYLNTKEREHDAFFEQTYLLDEYSLSKNYARELAKDGKTVLSVKVAQYLGQVRQGGEYVDYKKVAPLRQAVVFKADGSDADELTKAKKIADKVFAVKKGQVREVIFAVKINEGYETVSTQDADIPADIQELINMGLMSEEEYLKRTTIRGTRVNELIFNGIRPLVINDNTIMWDDDRFTPEALVFAQLDTDEEETLEVDLPIADSEDGEFDEFADLFG